MASSSTLISAIKDNIESVIDKDVKPILKEMYLKRVQSDIYGTIKTPKGNTWSGGKMYKRRYSLKDESGLYYETSYTPISDYTAEVTLFMTHNAFPAPSFLKKRRYKSKYQHGALLALLQAGHMGCWKGPDGNYYFPRPLLGNLQKEVDESRKIITALQRGLTRGLR